MLQKLRELLTSRHTEQRRSFEDALFEAFAIEGRRRLGLENIELGTDYLLDLFAKRTWPGGDPFSENDFDSNVLFWMKRYNCKQLAQEESARKEKHEQLQRECEAFDLAEADRRRAALKKLEDMRYQISRSRDSWMECFEARNFLEATSAPVADVAELQAQLSQTLSEIQKLELAVSPHDAPGDNGNYWSNLSLRPARLARQTRSMLEEKKVGYSAERKRELQSQLASAERRVAECHERLVELHAQRSAINAKMTHGQDTHDPSNFSLVRARPSLDDVAKRRAVEIGWHGGSGVTSTI